MTDISDDARIAIMQAEIERLRAIIAELEAQAAIQRGTLAQSTEDAPAGITHGHAPSAPPHNE